jgi:hypothetical protein
MLNMKTLIIQDNDNTTLPLNILNIFKYYLFFYTNIIVYFPF